MIWNAKNGVDKILVDEQGREVPLVLEFNDETQEATIVIRSTDGKVIVSDGSMLKTTVKINGAKIVDKER